MPTSSVNYLGGLRTEATHLQSGTVILTDAPTDNHGKGEAFSPTDLLATSLATCILTTIGIVSMKEGFSPIDGAVATVTKVMQADPRRVGEISVTIVMPKTNFSEKEKKMYEHTAHTCPVARSLHPDLIQKIEIIW